MKKHSLLMFVSSVLMAVMFLTIAGLPGDSAETGKAIRIAVVMPSATTDMAFSQSMYSALKSVQTKMGGESALVLQYSENMFKIPDAAIAIRDYASQGVDIMIAHGTQYGASVEEIAKDFPKTVFVHGSSVNIESIRGSHSLPSILRYFYTDSLPVLPASLLRCLSCYQIFLLLLLITPASICLSDSDKLHILHSAHSTSFRCDTLPMLLSP